MEGIEN